MRAAFPLWLRYTAAIASVMLALLLTQHPGPRVKFSGASLLVAAVAFSAGVLVALFINSRSEAQKQAKGRLRVLAQLLAREQAARQQAEASTRAKDEFVAMVSHELRTPITAILGWARLLRTGGLDETESGRALETIERSAQSQEQLLSDLMDISRIMRIATASSRRRSG